MMSTDGILQLDGRFYRWNPEKATALVGISWEQLRKAEISDKLRTYLSELVRSLKKES